MTINHPTKVTKRYTLMGWFVLLSILAHGLFLAIPSSPKENKLIVNFSSPLQVTVVSTRSASKVLQTNTAVNKKNVVIAETGNNKIPVMIKPASKTEKITQARVEMKNVTELKSAKTPVISNPSPSKFFKHSENDDTEIENTPSLTLNNLRQQLKESIKTRFSYPLMARRMGWEGQVGLSLHIEHDGSLNTIQIARSSGHKVLDENARKTIQNIGRLQLASNLTIQPADTEIEIMYRLTDY